MVPVYAKPNTSKRRRKARPGAREGYPGLRRERSVKIARHQTHRLERCPHCRSQLQRCRRYRTRVIEDIPEVIEPVVTEHTIHRDYCPQCTEGDQGGSLKDVEPIVSEAMPNSTLGHQAIALTSWFHYGLGLTIDQIVDILGYHLQTKLAPGGLVDAGIVWRRSCRSGTSKSAGKPEVDPPARG